MPRLMSLPDHRRSATAFARGHVCWMRLVASTNSPHMHACTRCVPISL